MKDSPVNATRISATEDRYRRVADQQMRKFTRETNLSPLDNAEELVDWLISRKPEFMPKTWRQYKAALVFTLEEKGLAQASSRLMLILSEGCKSKEGFDHRLTSSQKKKNVTQHEEQVITNHLMNRKGSMWSRPCLAFFKAGLVVGLRPSEWQSATLFVEGSGDTFPAYPVLRVKNGKATNGRAHGQYRHLVLDELSEEDVLWVRMALAYAREDSPQGLMMPKGRAGNFDEYYEGLRKEFSRTIDRLFRGSSARISLYSCRHQFAANVKSAKYSLTEIAALMGHGTDYTASAHYGRKRFGRGRSGLPKPLQAEVLRIRAVYEARPSPAPSPRIEITHKGPSH